MRQHLHRRQSREQSRRYNFSTASQKSSRYPMCHTATHCNTLQHTATHCNTLQHTATHQSVQLLKSLLATPCVTNCQHTAKHTATHCNTLQHTATHESVQLLKSLVATPFATQNHCTATCVKSQAPSPGYNFSKVTATHCNAL